MLQSDLCSPKIALMLSRRQKKRRNWGSDTQKEVSPDRTGEGGCSDGDISGWGVMTKAISHSCGLGLLIGTSGSRAAVG